MATAASRTLPPDALRGIGIGIIVAAAFGMAWAHWASPLLARLPAFVALSVNAAAIAVSVALAVAGAGLVHRGRRAGASVATAGTTVRTAMRRRFLWVLAGEIVALNVAAFLLFRNGLPQYLAPAVAMIVGLHFFPLAPTFRARHFHVTAAVMTLAGVVAALAIAGGYPVVTAAGLAKLACALTLWTTAFVSWRRARGATSVVVARTA